MFTTYTVRSSDSVRHRRVVAHIETQGEAIDMAKRDIFDKANYTVVQYPIGATLTCLPTLSCRCYIPRVPEKRHIRALRQFTQDDE